MKNTQLRNDNKVIHNGNVKTIDGVVRCHVCFVEEVTQQFEQDVYGPWVDLDEVEFIPLSEEILLKCGFIKLDRHHYFYILSYDMRLKVSGDLKMISWDNLSLNDVKLKSLHQLQNFYCLLSNGKELEIEL